MKRYAIAILFLCAALIVAAPTTPALMGQAARKQVAEQVYSPIQKPEPVEEPKFEPLGSFTVTWYCSCEKCCGKLPGHSAYGITATGTRVTEGRTAAADWDVLPPGTEIYIEGVGTRIIEDKGGAVKGNHIDVYVGSHDEARQNGKQTLNVYEEENK